MDTRLSTRRLTLAPMRSMLGLIIGLLLTAGAAWGAQTNRYVWRDNPNPPQPPYDTWDNAAHDIQSAVDIANDANGDEVIVRAGVYDNGGRRYGSNVLTNRVLVTSGLTVRSENNDPENTIIKGAWDPVSTNGPAAVRPVYLYHGGAVLIGFTLTNGATLAEGGGANSSREYCGGGIYVDSANHVSNCIISGNVAQSFSGNGGGGAVGGTYYNCQFLYNSFANNPSHPYGGGAHNATLYHCQLIGNTAGVAGGAYRGALHGCLVSNNTASAVAGWTGTTYGGGIRGQNMDYPVHAYDSIIINNQAVDGRGGGAGPASVLDNCLIKGNSAIFGGGVQGEADASYVSNSRIISNTASHGGGMYRTFATNTVIALNYAAYGGGVREPRALVNCLIYGNSSASYAGAGIHIGQTWYAPDVISCTIVGNDPSGIRMDKSVAQLENTILFDNAVDNWLENGGTLVFSNSCTMPEQALWDASNITEDPRFIAMGSGYGQDHVPGNYRLRPISPALNAGVNRDWMIGAVDLDGNPRIDQVTGKVDMGAYERVFTGTTIMVR